MPTSLGVFVLVVVGIIAFVAWFVRRENKDSFSDKEIQRLAAYRRFTADMADLAIEHSDVYGEMSMYINDRLRKLNQELEKI